MAEKFSSFERVVGNIAEAEKEKILREKGERFDDQFFERMKGKEREKTPEELEIISLVDEATNKLRRKYGLEDFNIPAKNIHVIKEEEWSPTEAGLPEGKGVAVYSHKPQAVAMREQPHKIVFMKFAFHEMLHFKSYGALQITSGDSPELQDYRMGLIVHTRDGKTKYFTNLNEAVTEEMTIRFASKLFDNQLFAEERRQTKKLIKKYPNAQSDSGGPLFTDDTYCADIDKKKTWGQAIGRIFGRERMVTAAFTYPAERKILNTLIDKIFERNPEQFKDKEEVFEVFCQSMMTGNILPIGRLIDNTFSHGTLRRIGEMDQNIKEQEEFVNSL